MPRKGMRSRRGGRSRGFKGPADKASPIAKCNCRLIFSGGTAGGSVVHADFVIGNLGARAVALGAQFNLFRIKKIKLRQFVLAISSDTNDIIQEHALAWTPQPFATITTPPTSLSQLIDYPSSRADVGMRVIQFTIGGNQLMGSRTTKWLYTQTTGVPAVETSAGCLFSLCLSNSGDTTSMCRIIAFIDIEFKDPIDPGLSLMKELRMEPDQGSDKKEKKEEKKGRDLTFGFLRV